MEAVLLFSFRFRGSENYRTQIQRPPALGRPLGLRRNAPEARRARLRARALSRRTGSGGSHVWVGEAPPCRRCSWTSWRGPAGTGAMLPWPGRRSRGRDRRPFPGFTSGGAGTVGAGQLQSAVTCSGSSPGSGARFRYPENKRTRNQRSTARGRSLAPRRNAPEARRALLLARAFSRSTGSGGGWVWIRASPPGRRGPCRIHEGARSGPPNTRRTVPGRETSSPSSRRSGQDPCLPPLPLPCVLVRLPGLTSGFLDPYHRFSNRV